MDSALPDGDASEVDPRALALIEAMADCCHPRVGRLTSRLLATPQAEQLQLLQAEVRNLLVLSFGAAEAERRLEALQSHPTGLPAW